MAQKQQQKNREEKATKREADKAQRQNNVQQMLSDGQSPRMFALTLLQRLVMAGLIQLQGLNIFESLSRGTITLAEDWGVTLAHTRTHGAIKQADSTAATYQKMADAVRAGTLRCHESALSVAGYEGEVAAILPQRALYCAIVAILTAEHSRNVQGSLEFLSGVRANEFKRPRAALSAYGSGKVSTTMNRDTMCLTKVHLFGFYSNALNTLMSAQVSLSTGITAATEKSR